MAQSRAVTISLNVEATSRSAPHQISTNNALNLYRMSNSDNFILISEKDCQIIDPIKGELNGCKKEQVCKEGKAYIGRFDWASCLGSSLPGAKIVWDEYPRQGRLTSEGC